MFVQASQVVLSPDVLAQAIDRIATGETTTKEEKRSIQMALYHEQSANGTGDKSEQEDIENRNCLLRVDALLTSVGSE